MSVIDKVVGFYAAAGELEMCRAVLGDCRGCCWSPAIASHHSYL